MGRVDVPFDGPETSSRTDPADWLRTPTDVRDLVAGAGVSRGPAYSIDSQMGEDTLIIKDDGSFRLRELTIPTGNAHNPGIVVLSESGVWLMAGDTVFLEGSSPDTHALQIRPDGTLQGQLLAEFRAAQGGLKMWRKVKSSGVIGISPPCPDKSGCP